MLSFADQRARHSRRAFLRIGGMGAASAATLGGLPGLSNSSLASALQRVARDRAVVLVFMHGGPSQVEIFDPKPEAPIEIRSATGSIPTTLPGVRFGGTFPQLASLADRFTIVRSFATGDGRHDIKPVVGTATGGASLGSLYSRVVGTNRRDTGMPTNVALYPRAVDDETMPAIKKFGDFEATGTLGSGFAPFAPSGGSDLKQDMQLNLPLDRLEDRRALLAGLDRLRRSLDGRGIGESVNALRRQAFDALTGGVADAFDLSGEDPATIARYDTAPLVHAESIDKKWANHERYADNARSLGKLMLLARRLCERGCGFVTVTTNFVWDMHADANNAGVEEGMGYMGLPFDHAISAFLQDVADRDLSEKILLVCCGEMGRTPRINARGGRDHWGGLAPLMLSGGGIPPGQVIGKSKSDASEPLSGKVTIPNLVATVMHSLFDIGELRLVPGVPREVISAATAHAPIV